MIVVTQISDHFKNLMDKYSSFPLSTVDDELVKVVKICSSRDGNDSEDFTQQVLSGVRFASLLHYPKLETNDSINCLESVSS